MKKEKEEEEEEGINEEKVNVENKYEEKGIVEEEKEKEWDMIVID